MFQNKTNLAKIEKDRRNAMNEVSIKFLKSKNSLSKISAHNYLNWPAIKAALTNQKNIMEMDDFTKNGS